MLIDRSSTSFSIMRCSSAGASGLVAVSVSLVLSAVALFVIGAGITLLTGRSVLFSGLRQVGIGLAAAILTYGVGSVIGVTLVG